MITIRLVSIADGALLAALHGACFPEDPWDEKAMLEILRMAGVFGFLAARADEPAGLLLAQGLDDQIEILALGVCPDFRRRGIAHTLLARLLDRRSAQPCDLFLEVAEDNMAARALYDTAGFALIGIRRNYYKRRNGLSVAALQLRRSSD